MDASQDKLPGWTPYRAFLDNPLIFVDADGKIEIPKEIQKEYSTLAEYTKNSLPNVAKNNKIMTSLLRYSGLDRNQIKSALTWGKGPKISITENEGEFGHVKMNEDPEIFLAKKWVDNLQNAQGEARDVYSFLIGVTILHELTHKGIAMTGHDYGDPNNPTKAAEHGKFFENSAYGGVIGNYNDAVDYLNSYNERNGIKKRYTKEYQTEEIEVHP